MKSSLRLGFAVLLGCALPRVSSAATYYVSTSGDNANPGTESQPWRTARKAAQTVIAGDTVIFKPGTYDETEATKFANSGTANAPILFKSESKHGAVLRYSASRLNQQKLMIDQGREYITIQDFEITQAGDVAGLGNSSDYLVQTEAHHTTIIGNKIHKVFEDAIKVSGNIGTPERGTGYVVIEGNEISDSEREGIDAVRIFSSVVRFNRVANCKRVGVMLKGGIRSVLVYGNHVITTATNNNQGITLGGSTDRDWCVDPRGWEAYNCYGWSNIVEGPWAGAISLRGAKDSGFFNNVIIGANQALMTQKGGKASGSQMWYWTASGPVPAGANPANYTLTGTPLNENVWFKNNLVVAGPNSGAYATKFDSGSLYQSNATLAIDYNHYHGFDSHGSNPRLVASGGIDKGTETNGVYEVDPLFVANYSNLRLQAASPAVDTGAAISVTGYWNEAIDVTTDADGNTRSGAWDKGAYNYTTLAVALPYEDDFADGSAHPWSTVSGTWAIADDGGNVYRQTATTGDAVAKLGEGWTDQSVAARVKALSFNGSDRHVSVYGRYADWDNHYYLQLRSSNKVELRKKVGGVVTLLQSVNFTVATGTWYSVRLDIVGNTLKGYVDGVLRVSATDSSLASGGVALGMYNASAQFDDVALNSTPPPLTLLADDFETGVANGFTVLNGSWSVVTDGSKVYRQTATTGDATAVAGSGWSDQSISVRMRPLSFNGSDRHVSVYGRYTDWNNHYYLQLRSSNKVELRKKVGGTVSVLQSVTFPVSTNTWYDLRFDLVGNTLKGYVDGVLRVSATDSALATGGVGLGMFNASAQFDDLSVLDRALPIVLHFETFEDNVADGFTTLGGTWAIATDGTKVYQQTSTAVADFHAAHATSWTDQILQVDVKPVSFNGSNRHVSIYTRWADANNHYYLALRNSNTIELKKKVGGTVTTLQSGSFGVSTGTWYTLRLEAVGNSLKAYIDGSLVLSATDSSLTSGRIALGGYAASVSFGDVLVTAP